MRTLQTIWPKLAKTILIFVSLLVAFMPTLAAADDARELLNSYSLTLGAVYEGGATDYSAFRNKYGISPRGTGIRYSERNGIISGTISAIVIGLIIAAGAAAKASGPKSITYENHPTYYIEKTTYYSEAEKQEINERASRTGSAMAGGLFGSPTQGFDLVLYSRNMGGDVSGFHTTMNFFSFFESENGRLDVGLMFGLVETATERDGKSLLTSAKSMGLPFRYYRAIGPILSFAEFDWNWLGGRDPAADIVKGTTLAQDVRNQPWRVGISASILHRLYIEAAATTPRFFSGEFGFSSTVGLRF